MPSNYPDGMSASDLDGGYLVTCSACAGTGRCNGHRCGLCHGEGEVEEGVAQQYRDEIAADNHW